MRRVSKAEWLQKALDLLAREGVEALRVERIARALGISKSGFYWHFKDREDLRSQIIDHWIHEYTEVVINNPEVQQGDPRSRLRNAMRMILEYDLTRYEVPIRSWADADPAIARLVQKAYRGRLVFIGGIFREMGFGEEETEMRSRLFVCYHTWERATFPKDSKKSLEKMIERRLDLLTLK